ncbi:MAG: hypothetical protein ACYS74_02775 [Planctomycetota bacterium]|jgi:hypothetical protein
MIILAIVLWLVLSLVAAAIDVCMFFLLIRLILMRRHIDRLQGFDDAGKALVNAITAQTGQLWYRTVRKRLSYQGELLVSLGALLFTWLVLLGIVQLL